VHRNLGPMIFPRSHAPAWERTRDGLDEGGSPLTDKPKRYDHWLHAYDRIALLKCCRISEV